MNSKQITGIKFLSAMSSFHLAKGEKAWDQVKLLPPSPSPFPCLQDPNPPRREWGLAYITDEEKVFKKLSNRSCCNLIVDNFQKMRSNSQLGSKPERRDWPHLFHSKCGKTWVTTPAIFSRKQKPLMDIILGIQILFCDKHLLLLETDLMMMFIHFYFYSAEPTDSTQ